MKDDALDEAHCCLGLILRAEGKYREAAASFKKALKLDPRYKTHAKHSTTSNMRSNFAKPAN